MIIRVIDFETTGLPPEASVCEAAFVDLRGDPLEPLHSWSSLVCPTTEMTLEALAVHHITEAEARDSGITWGEATDILCEDSPAFFAAHNADFEREFFDPEGSRWIDTYKVALRLWPDAPAHNNQLLRYYLELDVGDRAMPPHRALPDAWVTAHLLIAAFKHASIDDMVGWTEEPPYLTRLTFGKHFGKRFDQVPRDYLEWILRQEGFDPGVVAAAKRELNR